MSRRNMVKDNSQTSYEELLAQVEQLKQQNAALETELAEARHQLQEKTFIFNNVMESSLAGYWDWHIDEDYEYMSPTFKRMFGYEHDEMPDHPSSWQKLIHPDDLPAMVKNFEQHVQNGGKIPFDSEVRYYHKQGHIVDVYCRGRIVSWDKNGAPLRVIGVHIDISKLKQTERALATANQEYEVLRKEQLSLEEELRQAIAYQKEAIFKLERNERKLKEVQQLTGVGYWTCFFDPERIIWSPEMYLQFGLNPEEAPPATLDTYFKMVHPEDIGKVKAAIKEAQQDKEVTVQQRIIRPDNTVTYIKTNIRPWRDENGNIAGIYGGSVDITDIKAAQEEIARSEALQRAIFNSSLDALFIVDFEKHHIIDCNERAVQLFEFDHKEQIAGTRGYNLLKNPFIAQELREIYEKVQSKGNWSSEVEFLSEKGNHFWGNIAATIVEVGTEKMWLFRVTDITEHIKLKELLSETERMAMIGGWEYNLQTQAFTATDEAYHIYGLPVGTEVSWEEVLRHYDPEDRERVIKGYIDLIKNGGTYHYEARLNTVLNKEIWIKVIVKAHQENGWTFKLTGIFQSIDVQKKQELLLQSKQNELRAFVEAAPAAIVMLDRNFCYVAASEKWYEENQLLHQEIIGKCHYDIVPNIPEEWKEINQKCLQGAIEKEEEAQYIRKDGIIQWLKWEVRPWYGCTGEIGGIIIFTEDITCRKQQEEELIAAKKKAEEASLAKAQFLSTMSHEIRTPMNAVIGMAHILLQEDPKPEQVDNLQALRFSAENLLALINDILDFSKIEAGKIELEQVDLFIRDLAHGIERSLAFSAEEKGLRLQVLLDEAIPEVLVGDPTRLSQILVNLIGNAIKFTEKGSVTLSIEVNHLQDQDVSLHFSIRDTGIGIAKEQLDRIFESFSQADTHTTRKYGGTGLGLAITKRLLELFGTQIQVESAPGKGTHFYFDILFKINKDSKGRSLGSESGQVAFESLQGYRVLLAEDNPMNVLIAKKFLDKWELSLDHAPNGKVAVELTHKNDYDLILMDLQMPEMDGCTATKEIRASGRQMPIIALTASAMLETQEKAFKAGMDGFVTKPFNPAELYQKIRQHLVKKEIDHSASRRI